MYTYHETVVGGANRVSALQKSRTYSYTAVTYTGDLSEDGKYYNIGVASAVTYESTLWEYTSPLETRSSGSTVESNFFGGGAANGWFSRIENATATGQTNELNGVVSIAATTTTRAPITYSYTTVGSTTSFSVPITSSAPTTTSGYTSTTHSQLGVSTTTTSITEASYFSGSSSSSDTTAVYGTSTYSATNVVRNTIYEAKDTEWAYSITKKTWTKGYVSDLGNSFSKMTSVATTGGFVIFEVGVTQPLDKAVPTTFDTTQLTTTATVASAHTTAIFDGNFPQLSDVTALTLMTTMTTEHRIPRTVPDTTLVVEAFTSYISTVTALRRIHTVTAPVTIHVNLTSTQTAFYHLDFFSTITTTVAHIPPYVTTHDERVSESMWETGVTVTTTQTTTHSVITDTTYTFTEDTTTTTVEVENVQNIFTDECAIPGPQLDTVSVSFGVNYLGSNGTSYEYSSTLHDAPAPHTITEQSIVHVESTTQGAQSVLTGDTTTTASESTTTDATFLDETGTAWQVQWGETLWNEATYTHVPLSPRSTRVADTTNVTFYILEATGTGVNVALFTPPERFATATITPVQRGFPHSSYSYGLSSGLMSELEIVGTSKFYLPLYADGWRYSSTSVDDPANLTVDVTDKGIFAPLFYTSDRYYTTGDSHYTVRYDIGDSRLHFTSLVVLTTVTGTLTVVTGLTSAATGTLLFTGPEHSYVEMRVGQIRIFRVDDGGYDYLGSLWSAYGGVPAHSSSAGMTVFAPNAFIRGTSIWATASQGGTSTVTDSGASWHTSVAILTDTNLAVAIPDVEESIIQYVDEGVTFIPDVNLTAVPFNSEIRGTSVVNPIITFQKYPNIG